MKGKFVFKETFITKSIACDGEMLQIRFEEQDLSIKSILDEKADRLKSLKQISKKAELTEYKIGRVDD